MKDYTKYDFAAIVGAEVELQVKYFGCYKGKVLCRWEHEGKPYLTILVCKPEGNHLSDIPVDEIIPDSITAKIKVEDMSVKQLKCLTEEEKDRFDEGKDVVVLLYMKQKTMFYDNGENAFYDGRTFNDYIDCTDWGWKE